jgi:hypothetical protein
MWKRHEIKTQKTEVKCGGRRGEGGRSIITKVKRKRTGYPTIIQTTTSSSPKHHLLTSRVVII